MALTEEEVQKLQDELAKAKTDLVGVVDELKISRTGKGEAEGREAALKLEIEDIKKKLTDGGQQPDVAGEIQKALGKEKEETSKRNRERALANFKSAHKEFDPSNDPGGIKFSALESKLARFSTAGLTEESDFTAVLNDAYTLLNPKKVETKVRIPGESTSSSPASPKESDGAPELSAKEYTVMTRLGWTEEKYLEQKAKRPSYVKGLLNYMD